MCPRGLQQAEIIPPRRVSARRCSCRERLDEVLVVLERGAAGTTVREGEPLCPQVIGVYDRMLTASPPQRVAREGGVMSPLSASAGRHGAAPCDTLEEIAALATPAAGGWFGAGGEFGWQYVAETLAVRVDLRTEVEND